MPANDGFAPALWVGAAVVGAGALVALLLPGRQSAAEPVAETVPAAAQPTPAAIAA